ncbi:CHAP domain-containing protein [Candidatus Saccharibacteria bacterium]|nr:CHAP domain-containing protein [Candidatus Saccharibacteria bacterium]
MKALNTKIKIIFALLIIPAIIASLVFIPNNDAHADYQVCRSDACKEKQAEEEKLRKQASEAINDAMTVEGEIAKLNAEIAAIQANIDTSMAMVNDLKQQIKETEEKLDTQQSGLASLLVQMHFDENSNPLAILAGSSSLSDYAEKQARNETIKSQIAAGIETIRELKADLEGQKADIERLVMEMEGQKTVIDQKKAEQAEIAEKYRENAAAFTADAEAKHREMLKEVEWIRTQVTSSANIGGPRFTSGYNTYNYASECATYYNGMPYGDAAIWYRWTGFGGFRCQCVDYTGWKVWEYTNHRVNASNWGNANMWDDDNHGYSGIWIDNTPAPNTVAVSDYGGYGHVMWVESVNPDGTLNISEYNYYPYAFTTGVLTNPSGLSYIHLDNYH